MDRIDTILPFDYVNERRGDVFTLEFPNSADARAARRAAEVDLRTPVRPSIGRRALAQTLAALNWRLTPAKSR